MLKVACIAAIFAVAAPRPQGGFEGFSYQFPYSSQSITLNNDDDEDFDHTDHIPEDLDHHLEVYHPVQDKHEPYEDHHGPPKVHEEAIEMPMLQSNKNMPMSKYNHDKLPEIPKPDHEQYMQFPKSFHEKLPMSMMMMNHGIPNHNDEKNAYDKMPQYNGESKLYPEIPKHHDENTYHHEMPKYHEDKKLNHEVPKKYKEHKKHEDHHEKHEGKHENHHPKQHEFGRQKYAYDYKVEDPHTGDYKTHHETRTGDTVHGFYAIHEADGTTRIVEYSADQHDGFKATVRHEGQPTHAA